jgi:hypothetical protein
MPLLRLKDLIINTDHIIKAEYHGNTNTLSIFVTDGGQRPALQHSHMPSSPNWIVLKDSDARLMWSALTQIAEPVVPAPPKRT